MNHTELMDGNPTKLVGAASLRRGLSNAVTSMRFGGIVVEIWAADVGLAKSTKITRSHAPPTILKTAIR
jgi:hypothetical protein